ncbi:hypothetical protein [Kibdelosporangium persicum]|uniref:hypothetical protein n=1 Tax=Kibdelosporangium persicum TaxID=2698649 RepID=UPI001565690C|nr:hypothetical protein [Kibdelosporangium persicum]
MPWTDGDSCPEQGRRCGPVMTGTVIGGRLAVIPLLIVFLFGHGKSSGTSPRER